MMVDRRLILFCLLVSALACKPEKKEVLEEVLPNQLSALEEEILLEGIGSLMTYVSTYKEDATYKDFLIADSYEDFTSLYYESDSTDALMMKFNILNDQLIDKKILFYAIPDSLLISNDKIDSLRNTINRLDFWENFHNNWFPDKVGLLGLTKPAIDGDRAVFWFSIVWSGRGGAIFVVWMKRTDGIWEREKQERRLIF